jgi:hypothetical protein
MAVLSPSVRECLDFLRLVRAFVCNLVKTTSKYLMHCVSPEEDLHRGVFAIRMSEMKPTEESISYYL